jgi:hypothetical protein
VAGWRRRFTAATSWSCSAPASADASEWSVDRGARRLRSRAVALTHRPRSLIDMELWPDGKLRRR